MGWSKLSGLWQRPSTVRICVNKTPTKVFTSKICEKFEHELRESGHKVETNYYSLCMGNWPNALWLNNVDTSHFSSTIRRPEASYHGFIIIYPFNNYCLIMRCTYIISLFLLLIISFTDHFKVISNNVETVNVNWTSLINMVSPWDCLTWEFVISISQKTDYWFSFKKVLLWDSFELGQIN